MFFAGFNRGVRQDVVGLCRADAARVRVVALMLVVYVGLIGLAYVQFARTPSGFVPPLDRGLLHHRDHAAAGREPGAHRPRGAQRRPRSCSSGRASRNAVAFAGFDGATFTNAPNSGVMFVDAEAVRGACEGRSLTTASILNDLRGQMQALREAFVLVIPPPSVPGIGTGGGFKMYVQDRAGRGPRALEQAVGTLHRPGQPDAGPGAGVHAVQHLDAADLCGYRPHQGRDAGRADHALLRHAVDLYGLDLRQRLQHPGPHLSGRPRRPTIRSG